MLSHNVIIFTGPIAAGKTTVKKRLTQFLDEIRSPYYEISGLHDLYIPLAVREGIVQEKTLYSRTETDSMMKKIYWKFGKEIGTDLLAHFLRERTTSTIYIVDSKRNPDGIRKIRLLFRNFLIIGVYANLGLRIQRYRERKRDFDKADMQLRCPHQVFMREQAIFDVSRSLLLSDIIIDNSVTLPNVMDVELAKALIEKKFVKSLFPYRSISAHLLNRQNITLLIKKFYRAYRKHKIFVIQGGNQYVVSYLQDHFHIDIESIKLLCLSKMSFHKILLTLLNPQERISRISPIDQKRIQNEFSILDKSVKQELQTCIQATPFRTLPMLLQQGNIQEALSIFANVNIRTPFSYPVSRQKIVEEFNHIDKFASEIMYKLHQKSIIKILLQSTRFYYFHKRYNIVYLDDVFYRGRTYYAIQVLRHLLGVENRKFKFVTFCFDTSAPKMTLPKNIRVLDKMSLYSHENSIKAERGYWDETQEYFSFRNIRLYQQYLSMIMGKGKNHESLLRYNMLVLGLTARSIKTSMLSLDMRIAIIELLVFHYHFNLKINIEALKDQRTHQLGFCPPFVNFVANFINQREPMDVRAAYKKEVEHYISIIHAIRGSRLLKEILKIYSENRLVIDYNMLQKFYGN